MSLTLHGRNRFEDMKVLATEVLRGLERENCEYGGWGLDDKRPFGNSDVERDILEMLKIAPAATIDGYPEYDDTQTDYAASLYDEIGGFLEHHVAPIVSTLKEPR